MHNTIKVEKSREEGFETDLEVNTTCKRSRSRSTNIQRDLCFFCEQPPGNSGLHEAATFQVDKWVQTCAEILEDTELLAKLSIGDMVALDAKYHAKCLVGLYNRARKAKAKGYMSTGEKEVVSRLAFAELVMYIEETRYSDEDKAPVFKQ